MSSSLEVNGPQPKYASYAPATKHAAISRPTIISSFGRPVDVKLSLAAELRAAIKAMSNLPFQCNNNNNSNPIIAIRDEIEVGTASNVVAQSNRPQQSVPYGNDRHEVPAPYIKKFQAGEFFYLSKLLPKNIKINNQPHDAIVVNLENSIIKAKKASQPTTGITNIEQWTTAFIIYMSVMTHQYQTTAKVTPVYDLDSPRSSDTPEHGRVHL